MQSAGGHPGPFAMVGRPFDSWGLPGGGTLNGGGHGTEQPGALVEFAAGHHQLRGHIRLCVACSGCSA